MLVGDSRGGAALVGALVAPVLVVAAAAATELALLQADRSALQDAADAAALQGAKALTLASRNGVPERTRQWALARSGKVADRAQVAAEVQLIGDGEGVRLRMTAERASIFGGALPSRWLKVEVQSAAMRLGSTPLCVLAHGQSGSALRLRDRARVTASNCMVQSNSDLDAEDASALSASAVQASGFVRGDVTSAPLEGAEIIADPFADRPVSAPSGCGARRTIRYSERHEARLPPGVHCDDILLSDQAVLTLEPGEHYFVGVQLSLQDRARLRGEDVALVFDRGAFEFLDDARVDLQGRRSGALAGFLLVALAPADGFDCEAGPEELSEFFGEDDDLVPDLTKAGAEEVDLQQASDVAAPGHGRVPAGMTKALRGVEITLPRPAQCRVALGSQFVMASDKVERLSGVLYAPASRLVITGDGRIAEHSDWTVMVAEALEVRGSPTLVINARYGGSRVPVPDMVTPPEDVRLSR